MKDQAMPRFGRQIFQAEEIASQPLWLSKKSGYCRHPKHLEQSDNSTGYILKKNYRQAKQYGGSCSNPSEK